MDQGGEALIKYSVTDAAIAVMEREYLALRIRGIEDRGGLELVHRARMDVKGKRCEVEKTRKSLKEDALAWGRRVDAEAKRIVSRLEPIEAHLQAEEDAVIQERARIKAEAERAEQERLQKRIDAFAKYGARFSIEQAKAFTDEQFEEALFAEFERYQAEQEMRATEAEARKAEEQRLAAERAGQIRIAQEQAAKERQIREELDRIDREKREIEERKIREAEIATAKKAAAEEATRREREKIEVERIEKETKKAAELARMSDRQKLLGWAAEIESIAPPDVTAPETVEVVRSLLSQRLELCRRIRMAAEGRV